MLATGGSAVAALDLLRRAGGTDIRLICIVAAPEGIALVERHHPDVHIYHAGHRPGAERPQVHRARDSAISAIGCTEREGFTMKPRPTELDAVASDAGRGRRAGSGGDSDLWRTALTPIEPNQILVRGYALDELMGRLTFGESHLSAAHRRDCLRHRSGRLMDAMLVSFIDHGATPPSTLAARNTATTGASLRACVAAGVLGFGRYHGGDIESCMQLLDDGLALVRQGTIDPGSRDHDRREAGRDNGEIPSRASAIASTRAIRAHAPVPDGAGTGSRSRAHLR